MEEKDLIDAAFNSIKQDIVDRKYTGRLSYTISKNGEYYDFDLGNNLSVNWYLILGEIQTRLNERGFSTRVGGYSSMAGLHKELIIYWQNSEQVERALEEKYGNFRNFK